MDVRNAAACFRVFGSHILCPVLLSFHPEHTHTREPTEGAEFNADAAFIQRIERQLRQAYGEKLGNTDRLRPTQMEFANAT
ncbi:MAG: hypothetical protein AAB489_01550 [Patescibacteria group bacterium]